MYKVNIIFFHKWQIRGKTYFDMFENASAEANVGFDNSCMKEIYNFDNWHVLSNIFNL